MRLVHPRSDHRALGALRPYRAKPLQQRHKVPTSWLVLRCVGLTHSTYPCLRVQCNRDNDHIHLERDQHRREND